MNLLVLHGPNLNLIGSISARNGENITLSKIDSQLKRVARESSVNLKIMQTHKVFNAINFVQRNRNWADGLLFSPSSWSKYEYSLLECLLVADIITIEIVLSKKYSLIDNDLKSIFTGICNKTLTGDPDKVYLDGIKEIQKIIRT
tara:strand:+ start:333 stop:767 length:435 start_codon:yes stop_codon:yes gene_type:complete